MNMENPKLRILYIWSDRSIINDFSKSYGDTFFHEPNPLLASKWMNENQKPDGIICEKDLPGRNGLSFHKYFIDLFDSKQEVPFIIIQQEKNAELLKLAMQQK